MTEFDDALSSDFWLRVGLALVCGAVIGLERQLRGKPIGMRTSTLITMACAVFVGLGADLSGEGADPTRVVGQIIVGVGFLGAGVIMNRGEVVLGITSAAAVWMLAAIGSAIGMGMVYTPLALTGVTAIVLMGINGLERHFTALRRGAHADAELEADRVPRSVDDHIRHGTGRSGS